MPEKRLFERLKLNSPVILKNSKGEIEGTIIDLSENGLSFVSNYYMDLSQVSAVEVLVNFDNFPVKILAQPKWIEKASNKYRYGLLYISDKEGKYRGKVRDLHSERGTGYFIFEVTVYLKDVNIFGTGYFSRYFDWQGMAREEYFMTVKDYEQIMSAGIRMITKRAWVDYKNHSTVFDHIIMKIQNKNIKKFSFEMIFTYFQKNTGKFIAAGGQTLVFADHAGKLIPIPQQILDVVSKHRAL